MVALMNDSLLSATPLLDFNHPAIARLLAQRGWASLPLRARIGAVYAFVRDEIRFGYNVDDALPASRVLADGYGQCNTKATLLIALLRGVGVPARLHGATIHKSLQKGVVEGLFYAIAPPNILHSWPEVLFESEWVGLEGVILDKAYLCGVRCMLPGERGEFMGYGVGTSNLLEPPIDWCGKPTSIQMTGVNQDFGTFDSPDAFYATHGTNLSGLRRLLFRVWIRHVMNRRVVSIRDAGLIGARREIHERLARADQRDAHALDGVRFG